MKELNPATKKKRMDFASNNLMRRWDLMMFTDMSKFPFSTLEQASNLFVG